jgi:hypothetical protein
LLSLIKLQVDWAQNLNIKRKLSENLNIFCKDFFEFLFWPKFSFFYKDNKIFKIMKFFDEFVAHISDISQPSTYASFILI